MKVGNLGGNCNIRMDQLNSHASKIIKKVNVLLNK